MNRLGKLITTIMAVALAAAACKGSNTAGEGPRQPPSACQKARAHVEELYRTHMAQTGAVSGEPADDTALAQRQEQIADDVDMMLADCQADPDRFAPCLQAAVSVSQMERDCLVSLDDQGTVEGKLFGGAR